MGTNRWVLLALLLAGCASLPRAPGPASTAKSPHEPLLPSAPTTARLGVEFLHEMVRRETPLTVTDDPVRVEPKAPPRSFAPVAGPSEPEKPALDLSRAAISRVPDTAERMTLRFLHELLGEDRLRVQRDIGAPILNTHLRQWNSEMFLTAADRAESEDHYAEVLQYQGRMVNRPLRKVLKELPVVREVELAVDDFKASYVPLSGEYQQASGKRLGWGRVSVRMHLSDSSDPVELAYLNDGFRVASGQELLKLGYETWLDESLRFGISTDYSYGDGRWKAWGQMTYEVNRRTHIYCSIGDSMDLLTSTAMYPLITSPFELPAADSSLGILIYVEHLF